MFIREVTEVSAAPALAELAAQTFPLACPPDTAPRDIETFITENLAPANFIDYVTVERYTVLGAYVDDVPLGYSLLIHDSPPSSGARLDVDWRPTTELSKFYVSPAHHGSGIAAALMTAVLAHCRAREATGIWLGVNTENERAIRFYTKAGFTKIGTRTFRLGEATKHDFVLGQQWPNLFIA